MNTTKITPKDFFLWAGAVVALYWSVVAFILLMFEYINYAMPNPLSYYPSDPYQSGIPYEMASLIVLVPIYFALMVMIRRDIAKDATRNDIWVRRWALIFTMFVAGALAAGDLIVLLTTFLSGEEITLAFLLKVAIVLLVAAGICMHFIADFWGYWHTYPARRFNVFIGVGTLVVSTVVAGFAIVGTPGAARLYRFDDEKVSDLHTIQYLIGTYYQHKQKLPEQLADIDTFTAGADEPSVPKDIQTNQSYEYRPIGPLSYELCANFNKTSNAGNGGRVSYPTAPYGVKGQDSWQHGAGRVCFGRTIDPDLYPPTPKDIHYIQ